MEEKRARVIIRLGSQPEEVYLLDANLTSLGRESSNDIVVADYEVSRRHARILHKDDGYSIEDLGSTNGTFVNGYRLAGQAQLFHGDTIELGQSVSIDFLAEPKVAKEPVVAEAIVATAVVADAVSEEVVAEQADAEVAGAEEPVAEVAVVAGVIAADAVAEEVDDQEHEGQEVPAAEEIAVEQTVADEGDALDEGQPPAVEEPVEAAESLDEVEPVLEEELLEEALLEEAPLEEAPPPAVADEAEAELPIIPILPQPQGTPELLEIPAFRVNDAAALPVQDPYPEIDSAELSSDGESAGCSRYLFGCGCLLLVLLGGAVLMMFLLDMFAPDVLYCGPLRSIWDSLNPILTLFGRQSVCP